MGKGRRIPNTYVILAAMIALCAIVFLACTALAAFALWASPPDVSGSDIKEQYLVSNFVCFTFVKEPQC